VWRADKYLPPAAADGVRVDVYMVGRDERGGTDWGRRSLLLK
jgi:hypothetical protein